MPARFCTMTEQPKEYTIMNDDDVEKIAQTIEYERIKRKSLINSWMEGAFSSRELHERLHDR